MRACPSCRRHVRGPVATCPFCRAELAPARGLPRSSASTNARRSRSAIVAAFATAAVACGGTVDKVDASADATPDGPGTDDAATADGGSGFDAAVKDASVQDAFIAQDGFCCPLYGGSPGH